MDKNYVRNKVLLDILKHLFLMKRKNGGPENWNEDYRETSQIQVYDTGTAPCKTACPAHIAVQGYIKLAAQGKYREALELIKQDNPFPAICGSICNRRCEEACTRNNIDNPLAIDEIKRFIAHQELNAEDRYIPKKITHSGDVGLHPQRIAVIGAGPAGLSCAYFLAIQSYQVTVFDKNPTPGGMLTYGLPNFRLEKDVVNAEIDVARSALRAHGTDIEMYCLESRDIMPASIDEVEEAEEDIKINCGWGPKEIKLDDNGHITSIIFKKYLSIKDETGRFNPQYDENDLVEIPCSHVLAAIGQSIEWGDLLKDTDVEFNRNTTAVADQITYQTKADDVFVCGDAYTGPRFAIDAIAGGREVATSLHRYVQEGHDLKIARNLRQFKQLDKENVVIPEDKYDAPLRQTPRIKNEKLSLNNTRMLFTEEQVKKETERCLGCGATVVDQNRCIGCGICTTRCHFDAIHLERNHPEFAHYVSADETQKEVIKHGLKRKIKLTFKGN